jgi:cyclin H
MRSDAGLLFPPGQVALAAMRSGLKKAGVRGGLPREFLERAVSRATATAGGHKNPETLVSSLEEAMQSLDALGAAAAVSPSPDAARAADARVRTARASLAAAQRAAAAAADAGASEARASKIAAKRAAAAAREAELLGPAPALRTDEEVAAMKSKRRKSEVAAAGGGE